MEFIDYHIAGLQDEENTETLMICSSSNGHSRLAVHVSQFSQMLMSKYPNKQQL